MGSLTEKRAGRPGFRFPISAASQETAAKGTESTVP